MSFFGATLEEFAKQQLEQGVASNVVDESVYSDIANSSDIRSSVVEILALVGVCAVTLYAHNKLKRFMEA